MIKIYIMTIILFLKAIANVKSLQELNAILQLFYFLTYVSTYALTYALFYIPFYTSTGSLIGIPI